MAAVGATSAQAAPPVNDPFATPTNLASPTTNTVAGTTLESTLQMNEPDYIGSGGSVWYTWTAPATGTASFNTCDTEIDHVITIFTGAALNALTRIDEDDDSCDDLLGGASLGAAVTFPTTNGTQYKISVSAYDDEVGEQGPFTLKGPQAPPPPEPPATTPIATPIIPAVVTPTPVKKKKKKKKKKKEEGQEVGPDRHQKALRKMRRGLRAPSSFRC